MMPAFVRDVDAKDDSQDFAGVSVSLTHACNSLIGASSQFLRCIFAKNKKLLVNLIECGENAKISSCSL
jgi:hypothetical protein